MSLVVPVEEEAAHPEVVAHGDALAGAHLELPLKKNREHSELASDTQIFCAPKVKQFLTFLCASKLMWSELT